MKKLLLISDTHGNDEIFLDLIKKIKPDLTIHAGDFCTDLFVLEENTDYFVAGNNDYEGERIVDFQVEGLNVRLMHGDQFYTSIYDTEKRNQEIWTYAKNNKIDLLISGHSHIQSFYYHNNILVINPGSTTLPRNEEKKGTYSILLIDNKKYLNLNKSDLFFYV